MSNVINIGTGGGGGGGTVITLTGNDGVAVGPDGGGNIDLIGVNGTYVSDGLAPNTLEISGVGRLYQLETFDATETPFPPYALEFTVSDDSAIVITATVVGMRADFSASMWGSLTYGARGSGGVAIPIGVCAPAQATDGVGVVLSARVVGNDIQVTVVGEALTEWHWSATILTIPQNN